jgi:HD superfamily phosphohydrolase/uncharacterized protein YjbK
VGRVSAFKGKTIRDAVHGDIAVDEKFIKIIDTPEFQRLHRIRQLSTAYSIYPTAQHTRFSHSVGTFYVMKLLINHFQPIFDSINIDISQREVNLALGVALLHDIGHGPFSHAFEGALPTSLNQKNHEEWTIDIVTSKESNISKVLEDNFDVKFAQDLAALIKKERDIKKHRKENDSSEVDLFFILSSLISSQLDADRMDYLLRDAYSTGVSYGTYDISRLISSLTITVQNNKYYVCIDEKYLPTVEDYLVARYQMHEGVYLHSFKCEMEMVVKKILHRTFELYKENLLTEKLPGALESVFKGKDMTIQEYISLDDSVFIALFMQYKDSKDNILSDLCDCFINRKKYKELCILNNKEEEIAAFKVDLTTILKNHNYHIKDLKEEPFWLEDTVKNETYKDRKDNIWILKKDGTVCDLFEVSRIVTDKLKFVKNMVFISLEMLQKMKKIQNINSAITDINNLINLYHNRTHIEIEKKFSFENKAVFDKVLKKIKELNQYDVNDSDDYKEQEDYYYDTDDKLLYNTDKTLRVRKRSGQNYITIKIPTKKPNLENEDQNERFEFEIPIENPDLAANETYIVKHIPEINERFCDLKNTLIIKNMRKKIQIKNNEVVFEIAFDNVTYENKKEFKEYEIEIELKSDFIHRVNLKMLSDYLEIQVPELKASTKSKYKRGLELD